MGKKRKVGRPKGSANKFGSAVKKKYLAILREYPIKKHAAGLCKVTPQAVDYHRLDDPEFALAEEEALEIGRGKYLAMVENPQWLLQKSDPATYTDQTRVELLGDFSMKVGDQWLGKKQDDGE